VKRGLETEDATKRLAEPSVPEPVPESPRPSPPRALRFIRASHEVAWRDALRRRMLALADIVAVFAAVAIVHVGGVESLAFQAALVPVWIVLAKLYGLYDNDHRGLRHLTVDELPNLIAWTTTGTAMHMMLVTIVAGVSVTAQQALLFWVAAAVAAPPLRAIARTTWRRVVPAERAMLIGSGPLESATRRKLELFHDIHVTCVGTVGDQDLQSPIEAPVEMAALEMRVAREGADRIIVASQTAGEWLIAELVRICRKRGLKLSVVPPARGMFGTAVRLHHVADLPFVEYTTWDVPRSAMLLKRTLDIALSSVALVLLSPVLIGVAIAVRLDGAGPIFFVGRRGGLYGEPFRMIKFRTMVADAQHRLREVIDIDELEQPMFKLRSDPRITPIGRFLRRTSLDELPQLFNVLRGDMTLVGPRPEQLELVERYGPEHMFRLSVKPGLTGPMQVYGRGELTFDERLAVEREYVENLSMRRDLRIMLLTIAAVFRGKGAF
jgi:exopolysaccharide biosynthesis polyprenyl glycosylphosphotransferase